MERCESGRIGLTANRSNSFYPDGRQWLEQPFHYWSLLAIRWKRLPYVAVGGTCYPRMSAQTI